MTSPDRCPPPTGLQPAPLAGWFARHPDNGVLEALKWLALLAMVIDHVGVVVFQQGKLSPAYQVGRLAYPLFAMVLACRLAQQAAAQPISLAPARRLLVWALVSALPFGLAAGRVWPPDIFFTLALGAALCWLADADYRWPARLALHLAAAVASFAGDYFAPGVYLVPAMYRLQRRPSLGALSALLLCAAGLSLVNFAPITLLAFALLPLAHCLRLRMPRLPGIAFYAFYPLHLCALAVWRYLH